MHRKFLFAAALAFCSWACREKDDSRKVEGVLEKPPPPATQRTPAPPAEPWFAGRFQGKIPLRELPRAPELLRKKRDAEAPEPESAGFAELSVTIDRKGTAHITLTRPFEQTAIAVLTNDELRARFVPTPELLGSGTVVLRRSGDSFEGTLSLLDPSRTRPLRGHVAPGVLRKEE